MPETLLLTPTAAERSGLLRAAPDLPLINLDSSSIELCGFGPIAAAATTAMLIARHRPRRVLLAGICGVLDQSQLEVGQACCFKAANFTGLGAGEGEAFLSARQMGFPQFTSTDGEPIFDTLPLVAPAGMDRRPQLLTVVNASASPEQAARRLHGPPAATAEDMEGFGVALACRLADLPLCIVRGASNIAGDRDKSHWNIPAALAAAAKLVGLAMRDDSIWEPAT